jgi:N-acylneuraminate cytidylyltransferase
VRILGIIPARGGSKGLPGKNKKLMLGKPLISYTIDAAKASNLSAIAVSTDDKDILKIAQIAGIIAIQRPEGLSGDKAPSLPVLQHAVATIGTHFDAVMTLQPTSPLRTTIHINEAIDLFKSILMPIVW